MTWADQLGLGDRECVAIVGAGGKTTILRRLGWEAERSRRRAILTTTTHMAADQIGEPATWSSDPDDIDAILEPGRPLHVAARVAGHKVVGIGVSDADRIFAETRVDWLVIEADGARRRPFKAPAAHEPAMPSSATTVVVVVGIDAVGQPVDAAAHRPEIVQHLAAAHPADPLTVDHIASVMLHDEGGLKAIPPAARVVMAISKVDDITRAAAQDLAVALQSHPRVDRVTQFDRTA